MANQQIQLQIGANAEHYSPCPTCEKHPHYPQSPVTLHKGGICLICHNQPIKEGKRKLSKF